MSAVRIKFKIEPVKRKWKRVDSKTGEIKRGVYPDWYGRWKPAGAKNWVWVKLHRDKQSANAEWRKFQDKEERRASGVSSEAIDRLDLPVQEIKGQYIAAQRLRGRKADHLRITEWMLDRLIELGGWKWYGDITVSSTSGILERLAADGKTVAYRNDFIKKLKAFVHWALPPGAIDPLVGLHRISTKGAKKGRARRAGAVDEVLALLADRVPYHRRLAYALGLLNGLRRNEAANMKWGHLTLNATIPFMKVPPKQGVTDREWDYLPIHPFVLQLLNEQTAGGMEDRILPAVPDIKTLKKDLSRAGFEMKNAAGERLDFHGLRHTFTTWLGRTGCSRATRKRLTRHAGDDITDGYAHAELAEMLDALEALPSPLLIQADAAEATGTDGTEVRRSHGGHGSGLGGQAAAQGGTLKSSGSANAIPMRSMKLVAGGHVLAQRDLIGQTSGDILSKPRPSTQVV